MDRKEFSNKRIEGRKLLLEKIDDIFKSLDPVAIYQFGSGAQGFKDEFSDIDILIIFEDSKMKKLLPNLNNIYKIVAPILIRHHSKTWSPIGGSADSVIHETENGLFVVDYYISKLSETGKIYPKDLENNFLEKGVLKLTRHVDKSIRDSHTLKNNVDLLLDLIFISVKGIFRKWENDDFINTLKRVHGNLRKNYPYKLKRRQISLSYKSSYKLLTDLNHVSNKRQRRAIYKIRKYIKQIEVLY